VPVLVITGEKTIAIHRRIDEELSRLIPRAFTEVVDNFLASS
jgi:hypothetical protein